MIKAPFTPEQVGRLNRFQKSGKMHPFTCECGQVLSADTHGWWCRKCHDYVQYWAHEFMLEVA